VRIQGRYLAVCPDTPVLGLAHDAYFATQLDEALRLLTDRTYVRRILYGDHADDSRIGHTPLAIRKQYCGSEHESLRSFMNSIGASTPDSSRSFLPTPHPSPSPEEPKLVETTKKRKRDLGLPHEAAAEKVNPVQKKKKRGSQDVGID
jgi:hypothetical protein